MTADKISSSTMTSTITDKKFDEAMDILKSQIGQRMHLKAGGTSSLELQTHAAAAALDETFPSETQTIGEWAAAACRKLEISVHGIGLTI